MTSTHSSAGSTPTENWFVTTDGNGTFELSLNELTEGIETGRVPISSLVWRAGMRSWLALNEVPLLQLLVARLDLSRIAAAQTPQPMSTESSEYGDAPWGHGARSVFPQTQASELDDDDLTVVTTAPAAVVDLMDDDLTVVTKSPPDPVVVNDDAWTLEPQARMRDRQVLVRRIIAVEPEPSPQLTESLETGAAPLETGSSENRRGKVSPLDPPFAPRVTNESKKPSLSDRAPPKPHSLPVIAVPVAETAPPAPRPAIAVIRVADPPSPTSLLALAGRARESTVTGLSTHAPTLSPVRRVTSPAPAPVLPLNAGSNIASQRPPLVRERTVLPHAGSHGPSTPPGPAPRLPVAPSMVRPAVDNAGAVVAPIASPTLAPATPTPQRATVEGSTAPPKAAPAAPSIESPRSGSAEAFAPPEPSRVAESLAPSVSGISNAFRPSHRPLYVAAGALIAVGAAVVVLAGSGPTRKARNVAKVTAIQPAPAVSDDAPQPPKPEQEPKPATPKTPAAVPTTVEQPAAVAQESGVSAASSPVKAAVQQRPAASAVPAQTVTPKKHTEPGSTGAEAPVARRMRPEAKAMDSDSPAPSKGTKKTDASPSVASWDQGTVEQRPWMSPGF